MRILVLSDSHRDRFAINEALLRQPSAEIVVHLGDGADEMEDAAVYLRGKKQVIMVNGNCDWFSNLPARETFSVNGVKVLCTHGYAENVKYSVDGLIEAAVDNGAQLVLYGHTHEQKNEYIDGVYYFNPGSLHSGEYGVVDITDAGIVCIGMNLH
ncbi:MAG: YfcE family phosphodiesterase [Clostridiales bacterium]|nr:YfcE family phosphodiesterase [Clostridiales bacterium]